MKRNRQRGATIVEAAMTIGIFLMFLIAILEFGRAFNIFQVVSNAARESARYAVTPSAGVGGTLPTKDQVWNNVTLPFLQSANISGVTEASNLAVTTPPPDNTGAGTLKVQSVSVTVSAPFTFDAPQLLFGGSKPTIQITSTSKMYVENQ